MASHHDSAPTHTRTLPRPHPSPLSSPIADPDTTADPSCPGRRVPGLPPAKSELAALCERFLHKYGVLPPPREIRMQELERMLGVARRRLYDVLNVMESLDVIATTGKLRYCWLGLEGAVSDEALLQEEEGGLDPVKRRPRGAGESGAGGDNPGSEGASGGGTSLGDTVGTGDGSMAEVAVAKTSLFSLSRCFMRLLVRRGA